MKEMRPGFGQVISGQCSYYDVASGSGPFEGKKKAKVATHSPQTPSIGGSALTLATPTGPHGGPHGAQSVWGGGSSDSFASSGGGQVEYPRVKRARRQLDLEGGPGRLGERSAASERLSLGIQPLSPLAAFEPSFGLEFADPPSMGNPGQQVSQQEAQTQFCQDLRQQQQLQQQQVSIRSSASGVAKGDQALSSGEGRDPRQPPALAPAPAPAPKRGNYRCSKCGQHKKGHICPFAKKPKVQAGAIAGGASAQAGTSGSVQQQQQGLMAWSHYLLPYQQRAENDEPPSKRQRSSTEERDASLPGSSMPPDEPTPAEEDEYSSYSDDDGEVDSDADEQRTGKQGYKRWTEEDDIALVAALRAGQTASTIEIGGRQAGTAFDRLHRAKVNGYGAPVLREYLEKPRRDSSGATEPWSAEEDLTFIQAHRDGKTQREIAAMLPGRSYHAVTGRWKEAKKPGGKYGSAALRAYAAAYCKSKKPVS